MKNCSTSSIPTPYLRVFNHLVGFDGAATSHDKILCGSRAFAALKPALHRAWHLASSKKAHEAVEAEMNVVRDESERLRLSAMAAEDLAVFDSQLTPHNSLRRRSTTRHSAARKVYSNATSLKKRTFPEQALSVLRRLVESCALESEVVCSLVRDKVS
jgi:hypothetical protein